MRRSKLCKQHYLTKQLNRQHLQVNDNTLQMHSEHQTLDQIVQSYQNGLRQSGNEEKKENRNYIPFTVIHLDKTISVFLFIRKQNKIFLKYKHKLMCYFSYFFFVCVFIFHNIYLHLYVF